MQATLNQFTTPDEGLNLETGVVTELIDRSLLKHLSCSRNWVEQFLAPELPVPSPSCQHLDLGTYDISVQPTDVSNFNSAQFSGTTGYGVVNAAAAVAQAIATPTENFFEVPNQGGSNWGLDRVQAPEVWAQGYTGQGIIVAVVDTGVDYTHPDLNDNIWINSREIPNDGIDNDGNGFIDDVLGWNFVNRTNNPFDEDGHGTHVAGTIAAENNGFGITGVAYNAQIMPVKVLGSDGGTYADVAAGIRYAADNGAQVINLSLGGSTSSYIVTEAVKYATERGAVVVMASGNEGRVQPSFPANLAQTWGISVGAIDWNNHLANFSNRAGRTPLDFVVAPGVSILSTTPNNTYSYFSGTSMATPHVAGVAALMLSANSNLQPAQVETLIVQTATT
jgi:subtilisin family serine protease